MTTIKLRRDTSANWAAANPVLALAEPGLETDTSKIKYGDGSTSWAELPYASGGSSDRLVNGDFSFILGADGKLTLPTDGSIDTYSGTGGFKITTDGQIQFASGYSIGGSDTGLGLRMATDRGTILFGNHPEPGTTTHFHIMKQDPYHVDLFLGDDFNYVKLKGFENIPPSQPYGVEIGTNDSNGGSQNIWRFGTDGTLTMPDGSNGNGAINFTWEGHNWASISSSESTLNLYSLDVVRGDPKTNVSLDFNVNLTTNALDSAHTWTFKDDGTIQFPGNTLANSHDLRLFITADRYIEIDSDENVLLQYNNPNVTLAPGEIFNSGFNAGEDGLLDLGTGPFMFAIYTPDGDHIEEVSYWGISPQGNFKTSILQIDSQKFDEYSIRTGDIVDYYDQSIIHPVAGDTPPLGATDGRLWFKSDEARLYIMYGNQWIDASPTVIPPPMTTPVVESITFNDDTVQTTAWPGTYSYNNLTDKPGDPALIDGGNAYTALEPI